MDLTIHLLDRDDADSCVVAQPNAELTRMRRVPPRDPVDAVELLVLGTRENRGGPDWAGYLAAGFELGELRTLSHSALLLARSGDRLFAVTFGHGRALPGSPSRVRSPSSTSGSTWSGCTRSPADRWTTTWCVRCTARTRCG